LAAEKTLAPIRPCFAAVFPLAFYRVHGKKVRMRAEQMAQLLFREGEDAPALVDQGRVLQEAPPNFGL
jgi:hypothetical protein